MDIYSLPHLIFYLNQTTTTTSTSTTIIRTRTTTTTTTTTTNKNNKNNNNNGDTSVEGFLVDRRVSATWRDDRGAMIAK